MLKDQLKIIFFLVALLSLLNAFATDYFINNALGNDANAGTSEKQPFKSIEKINTFRLKPGDRILFAAGQVFPGELRLIGVQGLPGKLVVIGSYLAGSGKPKAEARVNFMINARFQCANAVNLPI